ncbi:MAG: deoxyribose-phosphate aldolase [Bryobacteraceae bacterium]
MPATFEEIAKSIELPLVAPEWSAPEVWAGLELAKTYRVATVAVRPCDVDVALRALAGSSTRVVAVAGFPHGTANTATKLYEVRDLVRRGAKEIALVTGTAQLRSREFQHVQTELLQAAEACHKEGARLTAILECAHLTEELKVVAARAAERAEADALATGTGFGPTVGLDAVLQDVALLRRNLPEELGVHAVVTVTGMDQLASLRAAGATRVQSAITAILEEWKLSQSAGVGQDSRAI